MTYNWSMKIPHTIVETISYLHAIDKLWTTDDKEAFKLYIALNPEDGSIISDTGGLRKIRWNSSGRGKRGGARVIYYYYNETAPLYLLYAYPKGTQDNLTSTEKKIFKELASELKKQIKERSDHHA